MKTYPPSWQVTSMSRRDLLQNYLSNVIVEIGLALQYVRLSHGVNNRCGLSTKEKRCLDWT